MEQKPSDQIFPFLYGFSVEFIMKFFLKCKRNKK